ncbi:fluoride efflux transporter CrcB [Cyanobacterium aponinum FACHB-4101]|uniref:fluoride efflux transporter CrcB n=1 Tax=Cyanobacterium aponinum TaxID=379064 RepID=UPI001681684A|nr:fluoride efflux transporter CrcB [Cyanobacterium aponinum]MBD2395438.1 fluoride efflux transporter CrcB [Cyanobacterium aponinum FACHB-4101]
MKETYFFIALGAILGALSRYYLTLFCLNKWGNKYSYGTLFANLSGSFLIGFISTIIFYKIISLELQQFILIGFLGAYTTFSSYILDTSNLYREKRFMDAMFYGIGTPLIGFICIKLGIISAKIYNSLGGS